jgi:UTP-glucose-1-phosphate uridylyltransferase
VNGTDVARVVVAAGGLGTRVHHWARFIPKEFYPVDGRPGIIHLLKEIAALGPAQAVIVYHPYYETFAAWGRQVLSEHGQARYARQSRRDFGALLPQDLAVSFVSQRGPYADLTSVLNGADHFGSTAEIYIAFADNLYGGPSPLLALRSTAPGQVAVLARGYHPELAASHGVITTTGKPGQRLMLGVAENLDRRRRALWNSAMAAATFSCWKAAPASLPPSLGSFATTSRYLTANRSCRWPSRPGLQPIQSTS